MNKLKLDLDTLSVQSFQTANEAAAGRGTVQGRDALLAPSVVDHTMCTCPGLCQRTVVAPDLTAPAGN
ncbi:MAG TPA: hypothetical protein VFS20_29325 [Longimicrobium sp.]|nr:hypothetical protein [Longimicrobium sp.]